MKVHLLLPLDPHTFSTLKQKLNPQIELTIGDQIPNPAEFHVLVSGVPSQEVIESSPNLKSLIIPWAGLPTATRELMLKYPQISVHNLHHNASATAETALALLFAAAKFVIPFDKSLRAHNWSPRYEPNPSMLLQGKTALILGYGAIGQYVGKVLSAMDMRVIGIRRSPEVTIDDGTEIFSLVALPKLLSQADVLIIALPGTPETECLIGESELALLPPGAVLVNVGRGSIVDAGALFNALKSGHLRGARLDVWYNYPPDPESRANTSPSEYPFHVLENVVMSPHRGGGSEDSEQLRILHLAEMLNSAARGELILNRVDLTAGY